MEEKPALEERRHWDGREFDEYIAFTEGTGAYSETPEEYLCRTAALNHYQVLIVNTVAL